jgi:4-hydroxyproline epimerase
MVGALLTAPVHPQSVAGVIFFNNVGTLGMCGHGLIGVAVVLRYLQKILHGRFSIDTPVGTVHFEMLSDNQVRIENVPSYRWTKRQPVEIFTDTLQRRTIHGDIAWGGNWFFICEDHGEQVDISNLERLTRVSLEIRGRLDELKIAGRDGQVIDHIELIAPSRDPERSDAKNFVLCPGAAYDRSPCGTGTSAKLACLAADGKLVPGKVHRQESIVGSVFSASYQFLESAGFIESQPLSILPTLVGSAYIVGEAELLLDSCDPFCWGLIAQ